MEPNQGSYSSSLLSATDNAVNLSQARGIHVLINFVDAPTWATGSSANSTPPRNNADFAHFVSDMVTRYRGKAEGYEIWNEQNTNRFWSTGVNAGQYANLLKDSYGAVKAADPAAKVVFGGLARNDYNFVNDAYSAVPNLGSYYDVMATHPYPDWSLNGAPDQTLRNGDGRIGIQSFNGYREVRQVMLGHGDDKPIWFTEFGWSTWSGGVSQATQAAYTTLAMKCVEQDPYVQIAFLYNLRNNYWANNADTWDDQLGITNVDFSQKLAYSAFKTYTPGTTGCTYREANGDPSPQAQTQPQTAPAVAPPAPTPSTTTTAPRRTRTTFRIRRLTAQAARATARTARLPIRFEIVGKVTGATGGRVVLRIERRSGRRWLHTTVVTTLRANGTFAKRLKISRRGPWRVRATYTGRAHAKPSVSRYVALRV
jgi:hypothetical protein